MRRGFTDWDAPHRELVWGCEPWAVSGPGGWRESVSMFHLLPQKVSGHQLQASQGPFISVYSRALSMLDLCAYAIHWHFTVVKINWLQEKKANTLREIK